ncbi:unnamed protein product [Gongylonema pulchrum]|uniref:Peptidase A1 domain-containing protein n=1 Tax=Gongylonema pulchrum TaxID=637853 RepID=A0A183DL23_9BILA|nr:unnamed protein product [Gongylonema pulchrum]
MDRPQPVLSCQPGFIPLQRICRLTVLFLVIIHCCSWSSVVWSFNLDIHAPIFKIGPNDSYFGFAVAEHFKVDRPERKNFFKH